MPLRALRPCLRRLQLLTDGIVLLPDLRERISVIFALELQSRKRRGGAGFDRVCQYLEQTVTCGVAQFQERGCRAHQRVVSGGENSIAHAEFEWNVCLDDPLDALCAGRRPKDQDTQNK